MLGPRRAYARLEPPSPYYIAGYIAWFAATLAVAGAVSATARVTVPLVVSLAASWMFVPVVHVLVGALIVRSAAAPRVPRSRALAMLLMGHAPWTLWLLTASMLTAIGGYALYPVAVALAFVPLVLTARIVQAFCLDVLGVTWRGALWRTAAHQGITWIIAAIYAEKAVGLLARLPWGAQ
ncbi:MAG: hypothetical protein M3R55_05535 [Acidobacteriota bacterium]|nr:hypothetical protein [Acidobacteriota bacterium]